jgi:hypothetical protein
VYEVSHLAAMPVVPPLSDQRSVLEQEKKEFRIAQELGVPAARSRAEAAATASKAECWLAADRVV